MSSNDRRPTTLKGVIEALENDASLAKTLRSEMITGIRTFCRCVGRDPSEILANPSALRDVARCAKPRLLGIGNAHFKNSLSRLRKALAQVGIAVDRRREMPLRDRWETLLGGIHGAERVDLRKLAGWCSAREIEPEAVTQTVFDSFYEYLEEQSIQHNLRERWHRARRAWNEGVALAGSVYPRIVNSFDRGNELPSIADFPAPFAEALRDYREKQTRPKFLASPPVIANDGTVRPGGLRERLSSARRKPLSHVTVDGYANCLRLLAKYLVKHGVPIQQFTSLEVFLDPELVLLGLEWMQTDILAARIDAGLKDAARTSGTARRGADEPLPIVSAVAHAVLNLARFLKADPQCLADIKKIVSKARTKRSGMTAKNKSRLNQFADPRAKRALLNLPAVVFARYAVVTKGTFKQAREIQDAVTLAILLELPLRVDNVAHLDLDRHIHRPVLNGPGKWLVSIPGHEVKNAEDINGEFTEETSAMLDRYVRVFRPALCARPSSLLFVSRTGGAKRKTTTSTQFSQFIRRELGLLLNPHAMRHVAANNWLDAYPQDSETVRLLLGHRSVDTTRKFYADVDQRRSYRLYHDLLDDMRAESAEIPELTFDFGRRKRGGAK